MTDLVLVFSDPACMGPYFSEDGDEDDVACILYLAQLYGTRFVIVLCGNRFKPFMEEVGNHIQAVYGCTFVPEEAIDQIQLQGITNTVYVHSPTQASSANWMERHLVHISKIYRQGDDTSVNFKSSPEMRAVLASTDVTLYHTDETNFTIDYDVKVDDYLDGVPQKIYRNYFEFAYRKSLVPRCICPIATDCTVIPARTVDLEMVFSSTSPSLNACLLSSYPNDSNKLC